MDMIEHNRRAWNRLSETGIRWGHPVSREVVEQAKAGHWQVALAGGVPVPRDWFGREPVAGKRILCLASGGGQQAPLLAAAGARVTSLELSDVQLDKDRAIADAHGLSLECEQGSMTDLSRFTAASFDIAFLPVAVGSIPDVHVVWRECARVLRPGGRLLAGMVNPLVNLFEENAGEEDRGLSVVNALPFAEIDALSEPERTAAIERGMLFSWSHTLGDLIGGQLRAGFRLLALEEAWRRDERAPNISRFTATYLMTLAEKAG